MDLGVKESCLRYSIPVTLIKRVNVLCPQHSTLCTENMSLAEVLKGFLLKVSSAQPVLRPRWKYEEENGPRPQRPTVYKCVVPLAERNISAFPPVLSDWVIKGLGMSSRVCVTG